jgi:hypothetical protein
MLSDVIVRDIVIHDGMTKAGAFGWPGVIPVLHNREVALFLVGRPPEKLCESQPPGHAHVDSLDLSASIARVCIERWETLNWKEQTGKVEEHRWYDVT